MEADLEREVVLVLDGVDATRLLRAGQLGIGGQPLIGTEQLAVGHIEADVEGRCEVVLGARTKEPHAPIVAAVLDCRQRTWGRTGILDGADREVGNIIIFDLGIGGVDRRS